MPTEPVTMSTADVVERLRVEAALLRTAVDALGVEADVVPVTEPGGWTAKDVIGHLIHAAGQIAFVLGAPERSPAYVLAETERLSGQQWNERAVAHWKPAGAEVVTTEFFRLVDQLITFAAFKSDDEMAAPHGLPWAPPGALWQFIGRDTFLHEWPAHRAQIELAADH